MILQLRIDEGNQLEELVDIENYMVELFKNQYNEAGPKSVQELMEELANLEIPKLDQYQKNNLDKPVYGAEIEGAVFKLGPHKALGPDLIPAFFYQEFWSIVRQDKLNYVYAFFHSSSLLKSRNQTYLTFIPKVKFPEKVTYFRPICLCNVTYRFISKILVSRLKPYMDMLITPYQNAFIRGRDITNNIFLSS